MKLADFLEEERGEHLDKKLKSFCGWKEEEKLN